MIIFGDFSANFKYVSVFHIRKDIRSGIRAALGYSPKCKSSISNLRNIFLISQNLVNGCENAYASSTFLVNGDAYILPYRLHTYLS